MRTQRSPLPKLGEQRKPEVHTRAAQKSDIDYVFEGEVDHPGLALVYEIDSVYVPPEQRRRGIGSKLMRTACRQADKQGHWLILQCYPWEVLEDQSADGAVAYGTRTEEYNKAAEYLKTFYARFGFIHTYGDWMYRKPRKR